MTMSQPKIQARNRIHLLPPSVAERIAAGEVIERPASVVKELVENSLDAGASEVSVHLQDGGKELIEILDNGYGMGREDLRLCLQRHATSKLSSISDLESIRTLGFRGEALPSVSAVSDVRIVSREQEAETAYELSGEQATTNYVIEPVTFGHFLGSPHGTCVRARGLFSQIPARLKFLKSQAAEVSQVREWLERLALTHPQVGFRLSSNDRVLLNLRPQSEVERVKALLSDGDDHPVLTRSSEEGPVQARVHWLQGFSTPQTRKLIQVVNRRAVRDRLLQQALLSPFRQLLLPGQFPALVLFLEIDPGLLDVNVHPTKTEVRFLDSRKIFHAIDQVVSRLVSESGAPAYAGTPSSRFSLQASSSRPEAWKLSEPSVQKGWDFSSVQVTGGNPVARFDLKAHAQSFASEPDVDMPLASETSSQARAGQACAGQASADQTPTNAIESGARSGFALSHPFRPELYTGLVFNTYLIYDLGQELGLIDQHAAHERIRYELLRKRRLGELHALTPQSLLLPEAVKFPEENRTVMEERVNWLNALGFEVELFGDDTVLFRAVPAEWGVDSLRTRLKGLIDRLLAHEGLALEPDSATGPGSQLLMDEKLFEAIASEACHSAIRAGDRLERVEALRLVEELFGCEHPWNCPHGRPTVARVPKARFEEWFQRRV